MRWVLLLLLALASCREGASTKNLDLCDRTCYEGDPAYAGVGVCNLGTYDCDGGRVCVGASSPSPEVCDGLDNDCDGEIDEIAGCCKTPVPELCNGKDDDCDGEIDEGLSSSTFCYDGPPGTAGNGVCRPGVVKCLVGRYQCQGTVLPEAEICDGLDNDCDGKVDEDLHQEGAIDLLMVLDTSCSMQDKIYNIRTAAAGFAAQYRTDKNLHWALVTAPDMDVAKWGIVPNLYLDFKYDGGYSTVDHFQAAINRQQATGSGNEPVLDALWNICSNANPIGISWTPGARKIVVVFSDEPPDTFAVPANTAPIVAGACVAAGISLNLFVPLNNLDPGWAYLAQKTQGRLFEIAGPYLAINLETVLPGLICR